MHLVGKNKKERNRITCKLVNLIKFKNLENWRGRQSFKKYIFK